MIQKCYTVVRNLCNECVQTCDTCKVSVCIECKLCLCRVHLLHTEEQKKGKIKTKTTDYQELKAIINPKIIKQKSIKN